MKLDIETLLVVSTQHQDTVLRRIDRALASQDSQWTLVAEHLQRIQDSLPTHCREKRTRFNCLSNQGLVDHASLHEVTRRSEGIGFDMRASNQVSQSPCSE